MVGSRFKSKVGPDSGLNVSFSRGARWLWLLSTRLD